MRTPRVVVRQWLCPYFHTHEVDWVFFYATTSRRCRHCEKAMPADRQRPTVGTTHPDAGD